MVEKRVDPSTEERIKWLQWLVHDLYLCLDTEEWPPSCPRCQNERLYECQGMETLITERRSETITWKCPKCGFFIDSAFRIDPKSLRWIDPDTGRFTDRPTASSQD